jgi:hypothetical protein
MWYEDRPSARELAEERDAMIEDAADFESFVCRYVDEIDGEWWEEQLRWER